MKHVLIVTYCVVMIAALQGSELFKHNSIHTTELYEKDLAALLAVKKQQLIALNREAKQLRKMPGLESIERASENATKVSIIVRDIEKIEDALQFLNGSAR